MKHLASARAGIGERNDFVADQVIDEQHGGALDRLERFEGERVRIAPDIGDFDEVTVIELMIKPGDTVAVDQSLIAVESDKAWMENPSRHAGVVTDFRVMLGDKVKQGNVAAALEVANAGVAQAGLASNEA